MAGRIPQQFIDELLARTDIVDLIDGFVPLKKAGKDFQACCPFHDEKTPSFTVSQPKQFYHCFGCGANGTAISFLMEYNHLEFLEAIEELANKAGLPIPQEASLVKTDSNLSELYELLELVVRYYSRQLREHPQSGRAVEYLKDRGISGEIAKAFELGYAPAGWDNLIQELGSSDAAKQRLAKSGMLIKRDNGGYYDRFRDRIMFPIRDPRGRVIGFGGRVLDDDTPKYLNSPETPIYSKGRELYGLYQARHANKDLQRIYVVEGYMDVIALAQFGINNAVASLGTAATSEHLERLFRVTPQVVFCFDGDNAGRKAAWRALETALPMLRDGRQVFYSFMDEGEDPDTYIRTEGKDSFEDQNKYKPLSDYLLETITKQNDTTTREGKGKLCEETIPYISRMPHSSLRNLIVDKLSELTDVDSLEIERRVAGLRDSGRASIKSREEERSLLGLTVKLILRKPQLVKLIDEKYDIGKFTIPGKEFLIELVEQIHQTPDITCAGLIEKWRGTKYENRLSQLAPAGLSAYSDENALEADESLESEFLDAIHQLSERSRKQLRRQLDDVKSVKDLSDEQKDILKGIISSRNKS